MAMNEFSRIPPGAVTAALINYMSGHHCIVPELLVTVIILLPVVFKFWSLKFDENLSFC